MEYLPEIKNPAIDGEKRFVLYMAWLHKPVKNWF